MDTQFRGRPLWDKSTPILVTCTTTIRALCHAGLSKLMMQLSKNGSVRKSCFFTAHVFHVASSLWHFKIWATLTWFWVARGDVWRARITSKLILFYQTVEGEEIGMLEDMEVGISDLQRVVFQITEAKTDDLSDLQPVVCGRRWDMISFSVCFF